METTQDYVMVTLKLFGALGLLIYGMRMMSEALQKMAGPQLRHVLGRMTTNRLTGMLTGMFVTCAVQSSSATTVMTVSFVSAGLLTLAQAISVIMGANIGTTLTAWIMSLGYNVDLTNAVFPAFFVGMVLIYKKRHRFVGDFLFGIAFMFLSLVMLSSAGREMDLEHNEAVVSYFASFDTGSYWTILAFLGIGTLITCVVQSSAAIMAITILLCSTGVLPIYLGIALVLGENIGTTATANLAALGANIQARRAALAHLLFNVFGVVWVLCVFYPFVDLVCQMVGGLPPTPSHRGGVEASPMGGGLEGASIPVVLALFHTCFNVTNTAILIGFVPQLERMVCWLLPERSRARQEKFRLRYIQTHLIQTPEIAVLQAQQEVMHFGQRVQRMFGLVGQLLDAKSDKEFAHLYGQIENQEDITDQTEIEIARYLEQVSENHLSDDTKTKVRQLMREIGELESIGDACYNLARVLSRRQESGKDFSADQYAQLHTLTELTDKALLQMNHVLGGRREENGTEETFRIEDEINAMCQQLKTANIQAIDEREYSYAIGIMFIDFINECEKLGDYVVNVVQAKFSD